MCYKEFKKYRESVIGKFFPICKFAVLFEILVLFAIPCKKKANVYSTKNFQSLVKNFSWAGVKKYDKLQRFNVEKLILFIVWKNNVVDRQLLNL